MSFSPWYVVDHSTLLSNANKTEARPQALVAFSHLQ